MDGSSLPERPKPSAKPPKPPRAPRPPKSGNKPDKQPRKDVKAADDLPVVQDPNFMFKTGFLADVYREKPVSDQLPRILTRMPPEPNVSSNNI
jgi:glutaminyl-tRNA synthetase